MIRAYVFWPIPVPVPRAFTASNHRRLVGAWARLRSRGFIRLREVEER